MGDSALSVATQLINAIQSGRREASYKQCFGLALTLECAAEPDRSRVSLLDLADRFIDLYWSPLDPFGDIPLRQVKNGNSTLLAPIQDLKAMSNSRGAWKPGRSRVSADYTKARKRIAQGIAQYPARRIQPRSSDHAGARGDFLYDSAWLSERRVTIPDLDAHGWHLSLLPGVAQALAASSTLLVPVLQRLWQDEVVRLNATLSESRRLTRHLFRSDRAALLDVRKPLCELQGNRCFYCGSSIGRTAHIDHVIPWSRCASDDLANLVAVDKRCNQAKSDHLPSESTLAAATGRDGLEELADQLQWELSRVRVQANGRALIAMAVEGTPLWELDGRLAPKEPA